jgi:hypothetical protein
MNYYKIKIQRKFWDTILKIDKSTLLVSRRQFFFLLSLNPQYNFMTLLVSLILNKLSRDLSNFASTTFPPKESNFFSDVTIL